MAKISTDQFTIRNQWVTVEIHYTQKAGFHYKGLPEHFVTTMSWPQKRFNGEHEMKTGLQVALHEYHEKIKNTKKVILYELSGSHYCIMNQIGNGAYSGTKSGVSKKFDTITNAPQYCFGFRYYVLYQVSSRTVEYHYIMPDGAVGAQMGLGSTKMQIIDWTPQREEFCKSLANQVQNLIYGVSAFFDDPDILNRIDSGTAVLSSGKKITSYTESSTDDEADDEPEIGDIALLPYGEEGEISEIVRNFETNTVVRVTVYIPETGRHETYSMSQIRSWRKNK